MPYPSYQGSSNRAKKGPFGTFKGLKGIEEKRGTKERRKWRIFADVDIRPCGCIIMANFGSLGRMYLFVYLFVADVGAVWYYLRLL